MKNKMLYLLILIPLVLGIGACEKYELGNPPASTQADFTFTLSNNGNAPCVMTVTNKSLNANGYLWDFGNGITSTEENPVVQFDTPGIYSVKLTCTPVNDVHYNPINTHWHSTIC
ncbi:MAG TPA: PKD domain-containing protein, partial [Bacteroidales bacterium]|nr:PKD domain-containing protein [Bacteroidales bacterium]